MPLTNERENAMTKLLTLNQAKMLKSSKLGYKSATLILRPHFDYIDPITGEEENTCANASPECIKQCLETSGLLALKMSRDARANRMDMFIKNINGFYVQLIKELKSFERSTKKVELLPTTRLNCLSDIAFEEHNVLGTGKNIFELFPDLQFIDYTKRYTRLFKDLPANYHLTYSINELTPKHIIEEVYSKTRFNCAAVFYPEVPKSWEFSGINYDVFDGDKSDLRHLDPRGKIIGLKYKERLQNHKRREPIGNGFVIFTN